MSKKRWHMLVIIIALVGWVVISLIKFPTYPLWEQITFGVWYILITPGIIGWVKLFIENRYPWE